MNAQQIVVGIYKVLRASNVRNIVERTRKAARAAGAEFSNSDATAWIAAYTRSAMGHGRGFEHVSDEPNRGRESDSNRTADGRGFEHVSDEPRTFSGRESDSRVVKESLVTKPIQETLLPTVVESLEAPSEKIIERAKADSKSSAKKPESVAWVDDLRRASKAIARSTLADLTLDDRVVLGQAHALRFMNCTKSESRNRAAAVRIVESLADLGRHPVYGQLTVSQYLAGILAVFEATKALVRSPWAIKSAPGMPAGPSPREAPMSRAEREANERIDNLERGWTDWDSMSPEEYAATIARIHAQRTPAPIDGGPGDRDEADRLMRQLTGTGI